MAQGNQGGNQGGKDDLVILLKGVLDTSNKAVTDLNKEIDELQKKVKEFKLSPSLEKGKLDVIAKSLDSVIRKERSLTLKFDNNNLSHIKSTIDKIFDQKLNIKYNKNDFRSLEAFLKNLGTVNVRLTLKQDEISKIRKQLDNQLSNHTITISPVAKEANVQLEKAFQKQGQTKQPKIEPIGNIGDTSNLNKVKADLEALYKSIHGVDVEIVTLKQNLTNPGVLQYTASIKGASGSTELFRGQVNKATGAIIEQTKTIKKNESELASMSKRFETALMNAPVWMGAMSLIYGPLNGLKDMLNVIIEIDSQMTEMKRVMSSDTNFDQVLKGNIDMANELSRSLKDVNAAYIEFAKQGMNESQAREMTKASLLAMNISDLSSEEAIQSLTSAVKQFKDEGKSAMQVVDAWNEVNCLASSHRNMRVKWCISVEASPLLC